VLAAILGAYLPRLTTLGRKLGAESPASPTTTTCRWTPSVYLSCNRIEARLGLHVVTIPGHLVGCCCARWA